MNEPLSRRLMIDFAFKSSTFVLAPWLAACSRRSGQETSESQVSFAPVTVDFDETAPTPHFSVTNEMEGYQVTIDPILIRDVAADMGIHAQESDTVHLSLTTQTNNQLGTEIATLFLPERTNMTLAAGEIIAIIERQNGRPPEASLHDQTLMSVYVSYLLIKSLAVLAARRGDITEAQIRQIGDTYHDAVLNGNQDIVALVRILAAPSIDA